MRTEGRVRMSEMPRGGWSSMEPLMCYCGEDTRACVFPEPHKSLDYEPMKRAKAAFVGYKTLPPSRLL